ncbi:erv26 super protein [Lobulomyces angularis]|nr:erv26 super protein [Lobulomyces angularis]
MVGFFILVWGGSLLGFAFLTLSLACGLYYLAELVEEHTVMTKKIIRWTTYSILLLHSLLLFLDGLPFIQTVISMACLGWYSLLLPNFPIIELSNPIFLISCDNTSSLRRSSQEQQRSSQEFIRPKKKRGNLVKTIMGLVFKKDDSILPASTRKNY